MPGRTVGRVYIDVDVDGKRLPGEVRALGKEAGAAGGDEFQKAWSKELTGLGQSTQRELGKAGRLGGQSFSDELNGLVRADARKLQSELVDIFGKSGAFDGLANEFGNVGDAVDDVQGKLSHLRDMNMLTDEEFTKMQGSLRVLESDFNRSSRATTRQSEAMNALSIDIAEQRQALLDIAAVEAAAEDVRRERRAGIQAEYRERDRLATLRDTRERAVTEGLLALNQDELDLLEADAVSRQKNIRMRERQLSVLSEDLGLTREMNDAQRNASRVNDDNTRSLGRASKSQKEFGDNTRNSGRRLQEWQVWAVALTGGAGDIATLGSAAGAGLAIVGTAATASAVGLGVMIAGFQGLTGELSEVAEEARPAASALKEMGSAFSEIQNQIQGKMFAGLEDEIRGLTDNLLPVLSTGFQTMATEINSVFSELGSSLQTPTALAEISALLEGFAPIFGNLLRSVIEFGAGLGGVFVLALPYAQQFASYLATLGAAFNTYVGSAEGQQEINGWLEQGATILAALSPLLGAIGQLFADLVTPETVTQVVAMIDNLTGFMPALTQILGIFAQLNIFGLIAQLLNQFGAALMPIMPSLQLLASTVADLVGILIGALAPVLGQLATALAPIITQFATLLSAILPPLVAALMPVISAVLQLGTTLLASLMPVIGVLAQGLVDIVIALAPLITMFAELAAGVLPPLIAALTPLVAAVITLAVNVLTALMPAFTALTPAVLMIVQAFLPLVPIITDLVNQLGVYIVEAILLLVPIITQLIVTFAPLIAEILPVLIQLFVELSPLIPIVAEAVLQLIAAIVPLLPPILELISALLPPLISLFSTITSTTIPLLVGAVGVVLGIFNVLVSFIGGTLNVSIGTISIVLQGVISFLTNVFQGNWSGAWESIGDTFSRVWDHIESAASDALDGVVSAVNGAIDAVNSLLDSISNITGGAINLSIPNIPKFAAGGVLNQATLAIAGEAGREAFVPLDRPLSQISPDVRPLAAFAQGYVPYGGGEGQTIQRQVIIHEGAIKQIVTSPDANIAASQVLDRLVASL